MTVKKPELKRRRIAADLSQVELAELTGVSQSYISYLESGQRQPGRRARRVIAAVLDADSEELFGPYRRALR